MERRMSQSLAQLYIHIIFHIKTNSIKIKAQDIPNLSSYIGSIIKDNESQPIKINGTDDHLHILCGMSKNIALSKLVEEIKRHSSRWIKTQDLHYKGFSWQGGYASFSVSSSMLNKTIKYIVNQQEHHKKMNFKDEYLRFLQEYNVPYDERYLFVD